MTSKIVKSNIKDLERIGGRAKEDVRDKVNQVIEFYKERKISQFETARNLITSLMSENKRTATFAKKRFDKKFEDIKGRKPLNERMAMNRDKKDYSITLILYG